MKIISNSDNSRSNFVSFSINIKHELPQSNRQVNQKLMTCMFII